MEDISVMKYAENSQKIRMEEALEARRQQEHFMDLTSHEMRNPLGAVIHCSDALLEDLSEVRAKLSDNLSNDSQGINRLRKLVDQSVESTNTIIACSSHQLRIADDVLALSKLDSKLLQLAPNPAQVISLLSDVKKSYEAEAANQLVQLVTQVDPSLQELKIDWIMLDLGRVRQILVNLTSNALKFSKQRSVRKVTIRMGASITPPTQALLGVNFVLSKKSYEQNRESSESQPVYLYFTVTDTGTGLTAEEKGKLFNRFSQASARTYNDYGGSGLGLCISQQLCEMQGGMIGLESQAGIGSTFAFFVKAYRTSCPEPLRSPSIKPSSIPRTDMVHTKSRIRILVVEDNVVNQKLMKMQLIKHGYQVVVADNGQEALDFIRSTRHWRDNRSILDREVDLILMDVEMPILDGLAATREIREYEKNGLICDHIPIVAVSANARAEQTARAIEAGMDDTITKPFRMPDLIKKVITITSATAS
ncbi:hypothetical protein E4T47_07958 [Aureobasidium subglaciale]|nr:hypothetical protein E4T47_07958 [Aureobasidium subglaciale]